MQVKEAGTHRVPAFSLRLYPSEQSPVSKAFRQPKAGWFGLSFEHQKQV
jgi:hypothetical protein